MFKDALIAVNEVRRRAQKLLLIELLLIEGILDS